MSFTTTTEGHNGRAGFARAARPQAACANDIEDALIARRRALGGTADDPLSRVAALLVSISLNNSYEGRDPNSMPDTLTSGFVADLLGLEIGSLAALLVDLRRRGLIDSNSSSTLRLKDRPGLEALADAG
ncbi:MAG TPA: helix-turn-helix domain-containing protein [Hyphomicrobium sp.]|jgi:CRP/FNR family transcriptional regulator